MKDKNVLNKHRTKILTEYSNAVYFNLTKDYSFNQVPDRLLELWYSDTSLSVVSLVWRNRSTQQDPASFEKDLKSLEIQLRKEFKKLLKERMCILWKTKISSYLLTLLN